MDDKEFEQLKEEKMKELKQTMAKTVANVEKAFEEADNLEIEQYLGKFKQYTRSKEVQEEYNLNKKYARNKEERELYIKNRASLETYDIIMAEKSIANKEDLFKLLENDKKVCEEYETIKSQISQIEINIANKYQERNEQKEKVKQKQIKQQKIEQSTKRILKIICLSLWLVAQFILVTGDWFVLAIITMMLTAVGLYQSKKLGLVERLIFQGINIFSVLTVFMNGLTNGETWRFCYFICYYSNRDSNNLYYL